MGQSVSGSVGQRPRSWSLSPGELERFRATDWRPVLEVARGRVAAGESSAALLAWLESTIDSAIATATGRPRDLSGGRGTG